MGRGRRFHGDKIGSPKPSNHNCNLNLDIILWQHSHGRFYVMTTFCSFKTPILPIGPIQYSNSSLPTTAAFSAFLIYNAS